MSSVSYNWPSDSPNLLFSTNASVGLLRGRGSLQRRRTDYDLIPKHFQYKLTCFVDSAYEICKHMEYNKAHFMPTEHVDKSTYKRNCNIIYQVMLIDYVFCMVSECRNSFLLCILADKIVLESIYISLTSLIKIWGSDKLLSVLRSVQLHYLLLCM